MQRVRIRVRLGLELGLRVRVRVRGIGENRSWTVLSKVSIVCKGLGLGLG